MKEGEVQAGDEPSMPGLVSDVRVFAAPKAGHSVEEYEDAHAVRATEAGWAAAVADGATETAFSGRWARLLVEAWTALPRGAAWPLRAWRQAWQREVARRTVGQPWYVAAKAEAGAFAALLGVRVTADGMWQGTAVGDCNVLHLRSGRLLHAWPFAEPDAFSHHPDLLGSVDGAAEPAVLRTQQPWEAGDVLLLATDALAAGLLTALLHGDGPLKPATWDTEAFHAYIAEARVAGALRNDDVTLVYARLG